MDRITTETGDLITQETVAGLAGVSTLNDTRSERINKEDFSTDPLLNGWLVGDDWQWSTGNENMELS